MRSSILIAYAGTLVTKRATAATIIRATEYIAFMVRPPWYYCYLLNSFTPKTPMPFGVLLVMYHATAAVGLRTRRRRIRHSLATFPEPSRLVRSFPALCRLSFRLFLRPPTCDYC